MVDYEELNKHRESLKLEIEDLLKVHNRIAVVQATGIGKSHIITEFCNKWTGKKIVLEPGNEIINYMNKFNIETKDTTYITYYSLLNKNLEELIEEFKQYDYIFLDEMHRVLAEKWGNVLNKIFDSLKGMNKKILGFSATPIRGDRRNVIDEIFNGIQTKPYYLADAILDNLLPNPNYHCGIYEITNEDKQKIILKDEQLAKEILSYDIDSSISKMIEENLDLNKNHKIICFVDKIKNIKEAKNNIMKWFNKELNIFEIHHNQSKNAVNKIIDSFQKINGLNILFCVNILNEGVHIPDVDCVIFLRKTSSNVVYNQQLGRVISQNIEEPIIFDLVNNATNPEWGYYNSFKDKAEEQNKKVEELKTKNGENLKIKLEQVDLIEKLNKINELNYHILSNDQKQFIIENKNKYTRAEFAKMFNCSFITIDNVYKKYNINDYKIRDMLSKKDKEFIIENKDNYTKSEFAKMFNCSKCAINNIYKKYNITDYKLGIKKLSDEDEKFIIENKDKYTITKFSKMLNCSETVISRIYKKYNITDYKKLPNIKILSDEDEKFIIENKDKYTQSEFAKIFNCNSTLISRVYKKYNITDYKLGIKKLSDEDKEFIIKNNNKYTKTEFAKMFGCSICVIKNIYKRHNIKHNIKILSDKDEKFIIENKDKYTQSEFAKIFNCNEIVISRVYKKYNITDYKTYKILSDKDEKFIIKNKDKYTQSEFAKIFNCNEIVISRVYKKYNITDYKTYKILSDKDEKFIIKNKDKYTKSEFAKMFNCSGNLIGYIYKKHNIIDYKGIRCSSKLL